MKKECIKVSIITLIVNVFLSVIKILSGIIGKSIAMISDGIHSLSDIISTIIVIVGLKISNKKADDEHQYGHERIENVASIILAFLLFLTGILLVLNGIKSINENTIQIPNKITILIAFISIIAKELMYQYTIIASKKYNSDALKADAWHHRSDAVSSIVSLIGIYFTIKGYIYMDLIASVLISIIILKISVEIFIESIDKMLDTSVNNETIKEIESIVLNTKGVTGIDLLKTRKFGNKIYIDLEINADKNITFQESHTIAHNVHDNIENNIYDVKHCMVHINPK